MGDSETASSKELEVQRENPTALVVPRWDEKKPKPQLVIGAIVLIAAIIASCVILLHHRKSNQTAIANSVCTSKTNVGLLQQAALSFSTQNMSEQRSIASTVKNIKGFTGDPNCLYIEVTYYTNVGDATNATKYLTDFNRVYDSKFTLSPLLTSLSAQSVSVMRSNLNNLISAEAQARQNQIGITSK
jgi:hypothetical protein